MILSSMAAGAALGSTSTLAKKKTHDKYAKNLQISNNLQAAADQRVVNTQSQQMSQQAAQARRGLSINSAKQGASNEARSAAMGGTQGGTVDRTASVLDLSTARMDQEIQTNLTNQLYQQELNKIGIVNGAASANAQIPKGPTLLDVVLSGATSALNSYYQGTE